MGHELVTLWSLVLLVAMIRFYVSSGEAIMIERACCVSRFRVNGQ